MNIPTFDIAFLDHVAIRVKNIAVSSDWYERVLGLTKYKLKEWGDFPVFLLAGKSGIALFPLAQEANSQAHDFKNKTIDHFAFHLSKENFEKAKIKFKALQLDYTVQDHHFFRSIYTKDPDGHTVELTTLVVNAADFYH